MLEPPFSRFTHTCGRSVVRVRYARPSRDPGADGPDFGRWTLLVGHATVKRGSPAMRGTTIPFMQARCLIAMHSYHITRAPKPSHCLWTLPHCCLTRRSTSLLPTSTLDILIRRMSSIRAELLVVICIGFLLARQAAAVTVTCAAATIECRECGVSCLDCSSLGLASIVSCSFPSTTASL